MTECVSVCFCISQWAQGCIRTCTCVSVGVQVCLSVHNGVLSGDCVEALLCMSAFSCMYAPVYVVCGHVKPACAWSTSLMLVCVCVNTHTFGTRESKCI